MKKIILSLLLIFVLLISGCSTNSICGNGIIEKGETAENCCIDVSCADTFECDNTLKDGSRIYFCKKLAKEDTYEFEKFIEYNDDIEYEYSKDGELRSSDKIISKTSSMDNYLQELETKGYDVEIDKEYLKHLTRRSIMNKKYYELFDKLSEKPMEQKADVLDELIELFESEILLLKEVNPNTIINLDKEYAYDIVEKISSAKDSINDFENFKIKLVKGFSAEFDVTSYDSSCSSYSYTGYLDDINVKVENTGGFAIQDPKVDMYLLRNGIQVFKEIGEYVGYYDIQPGDTIYESVGIMFGFNSGSSVVCGSYDLKLNLRSGADPNVIATITIPVKIE